MRDQDSRDGESTEPKSKERVILIEGAIMGLTKKKLALEKFTGIHKNDPS